LAKAGSISFQPTYNAGTNRYSTLPGGTPAYDANGFLNVDGYHIYSYDAEGKNTLIDSSTVAMTYDALGRWVERAAGGGYTQAIYSPDGRKLALASGQSVATAYVALPGGAVVRYTGSGLDTYWHPDWLGTVRLYTSASRAVINDVAVAPFGERYVGNAADSFFTGVAQSAEAGDFTNFPARNYHFIEGRWLTPDPAGLAAVDPADPQTWNRYTYVDNNPLALVDPTGMFFGPPGSGGGAGGNGGGQVIQLALQSCEANLQAAIGQDPGSSYHGDVDPVQQCANNQISAPAPNYGSGGGGGGGTAAKTGARPCVAPNLLQRAGITVQAHIANFFNKTIGFGVGGSVGAGNKVGVSLSVSRQIVVAPNGQAVFATSVSTFNGQIFNSVTTKGYGGYGGIQFSISNAHKVNDVGGSTLDYGFGGGDGWGGGFDFSTDLQTWQATGTVGAGFGGYGHGLQNVTTYIVPICGG
jgi:RHS repeat-associated protein